MFAGGERNDVVAGPAQCPDFIAQTGMVMPTTGSCRPLPPAPLDHSIDDATHNAPDEDHVHHVKAGDIEIVHWRIAI
jgi:hypothetical protein